MARTFISRLTVQGFKSFNKKISIPLLSGFNVIAGPNGSGKSNILDAISFVLGRTSAKSLRADRLFELIFHGGEKGNPADYASVIMYLDNSEKVFPFEDTEISIMRKVNKSGVSVYKLNGKTVTREKVIETLAAARIHPEGHNILLQGDVMQIIDMNAVERRGIIDEISGIAEYSDKRFKAQKDLDVVEQKLKEAEIIITQKYDIFKKLEGERNAAMRYQELQKQLLTYKASLAHKKTTTFGEQITKLDEDIKKKTEQNEKLQQEITAIEDELDKREAGIRQVANKLVDISKTVKIEKEISELRSKMLINKDKMDSNLREIERLESLIEKLETLESRKMEFTGEVPRAVQTIVRLKLKGVHGTIASLISTPEKYQTAIEVAAGPHLHDIIVDDDAVAAYCIDFLKRERIGRAVFLPLNKIRPNLFRENELLSKHGVIGVASKLIKYDTRYMSAIEFVFGNNLIVENLDVARNIGIGKARMITLDGDLAERSGAMVGGHYFKHQKTLGASMVEDIDKYRDMRLRLQQETNLLQEEMKDMEKQLKGYATSESAKELLDLDKMRVSSEHEIVEMREKRKKMHERRVNLEIEINRLNIERAKLEAELDAAKAEFTQYGEVQMIDEAVHKLEESLRKVEKELGAIGLVNMRAIEEFDKLRTEFDSYKQRYEKILEEKKSVLDMITEIETKRKEVFNNTLHEVDKEFQSIFTKMAGGSAALKLENPEDLESGLMIEANPEGKRMLNIDSMSGGEKTVVALAFVFAIQRFKPAPFYIMDEVDAALDKSNSMKVGKLIKELSTESQFIVITHNDQTIKFGDRIYGVSMVDGESKIIGLELPKS